MAMEIIDTMLIQAGVYWAPSGKADLSGRPTYLAPVEVKVFWQDLNEQVMDSKGRTIVSKSKVFINIDTKEGGVLWLSSKSRGEIENTPGVALAELTDASNPYKNAGAYEIKAVGKQPTFEFGEFLRWASL